jgi:hypothetical protein
MSLRSSSLPSGAVALAPRPGPRSSKRVLVRASQSARPVGLANPNLKCCGWAVLFQFLMNNAKLKSEILRSSSTAAIVEVVKVGGNRPAAAAAHTRSHP